MSIAGLGLGLGLGAYIGGPLLAGVMLALATVVTWIVSGTQGFQQNVDSAVRTHRRLKHRLEREQRLDDAGLQRDGMTELNGLVDEIDRSDGGHLVSRLELEELLDEYCELLIARHRLLRAVRIADRGQLERDLTDARQIWQRSAEHRGALRRRIALIERRQRWAAECASRAGRLADELAAIDQFIRLVNQRASCPDLTSCDYGGLDRRLHDLDAEEAALAHLLASQDQGTDDFDCDQEDDEDEDLESLAPERGTLLQERTLNAPQAG
jgi:hypothetical protein